MASDRITFLFKATYYFIVCIYLICLYHSFFDGHLDCFSIFCYYEWCLWTWVCKYLWVPAFNSCRYILRSGIAGSYGSSISNYLRNYSTVSWIGLNYFTVPIVHTGSSCTTSPSTLLFFLFVVTTLMDVKWCLIVVLICISLMISDISTFSYSSWLFVYHLWEDVCLSPLPTF